MLFVRLRSLLFELCPDHPVAFCETCRRAYTPEQLGTEIGNGCYLCRQCGADLRESLVAHTRTCRNLAPQKRSEEHTSELQSRLHLVCRLLLEKKRKHTR